MLIDTESSVDVLFCSTYSQMELPPTVLKLVIYEFACCSMQPFGGVELLVTVGSRLAQVTILTNFLVVDALFIYNAIIGQPTLNSWKVSYVDPIKAKPSCYLARSSASVSAT